MKRMKYAVALAVVLAVGLLSVEVAVCADGPGRQPAGNGERWDDGGPILGGLYGELAFRPPEDVGPPGPPRDGDDDRPPPRRERGPEADRRQPPGPPRDGDNDRPPPRREQGPGMEYGSRQPQGMPGMGRMGGGPPGGMPGMLGMMGPNRELMNDPEMLELLQKDGQLDRESRELAMQYRRAAKEQREKIKQQAEELVNKQFDVRQQRRNLELKRLEEQLQRVREAVSRREKARKELVEKRVSDLLGIEEPLDF